jgi:hypothetical protein
VRHDGRRGHPRPRCLRREREPSGQGGGLTMVAVAVPERAYSLADHQRWVARLLADLLPVLNLREVA